MKNGKKPNRQQAAFMMERGVSPLAWLIVKNLPHEMIVIHRDSKEQKVLQK